VFLYREPAQVRGAFPLLSFEGVSVVVRVFGENLLGSESDCHSEISGVLSSVQISSRIVACEVPSHVGKPESFFSVGSSSGEVSVSFRSLGSIHNLMPDQGSSTGGTAIHLQGSGFIDHDDYKCNFGSVAPVALRFIDIDTAECVSVASSPAVVPIAASVGHQRIDCLPFTVAEVQSQNAAILGGDNLDAGEVFVHGVILPSVSNAFCNFGNGAVGKASIISPQEILCSTFAVPLDMVFRPLWIGMNEKSLDLYVGQVTAKSASHLGFSAFKAAAAQAMSKILDTGHSPLLKSAKFLTGPQSGGTEVRLTSDGLATRMACVFGTIRTEVHLIENAIPGCVSPAQSFGEVSLALSAEITSAGSEVSTAKGTQMYLYSQEKLKFVYTAENLHVVEKVAEDEINNVSEVFQRKAVDDVLSVSILGTRPSFVESSGIGVIADISGINFVPIYLLESDGVIISSWKFVSSALVKAEISKVGPGVASLHWSSSFGLRSSSSAAVEFATPSKLETLTPRGGSESGGTTLILQGSESYRTMCWSGSLGPLNGMRISDTEVEYVSPAHHPDVVPFSCSFHNTVKEFVADFQYTQDSVELIPGGLDTFGGSVLPAVSAQAPWSECSHFEAVPPGCRMLGPACTLACEAWAQKSLTDLHVAYLGESADSGPIFRSVSAELHRILPAASSVSGGMPVVVEGQHISAQDGCYFDAGSVQPMHFISSRVSRCEVPSLDPTLSGHHSLRLANVSAPSTLFLYDEPSVQLKMGSKMQFKGSYHGGTELQVVVSGVAEAMHEAMACRFGTIAPVAAVRLSNQKMLCVSPAHLIGRVGISFGLNQREYSPVIADFNYIPGISHGNLPSRL